MNKHTAKRTANHTRPKKQQQSKVSPWDRLTLFAQVLQTKRHDLSLSLIDLARDIGVHPSTIYRWEQGDLQRLPRPVHFNALCSSLDLDPLEMYEAAGYYTTSTKKRVKFIVDGSILSRTSRKRAA